MIFTLAAKELKALFISPLAWLVLVLFQFIIGFSFLKRLDGYLQMQPQLALLPVVVTIRVTLLARLLENRSATLAAVADQLEYSSAQSFGRHVRMLLGIGAAQFRREYDAERMVARFRDDLVVPYAQRLRRFAPLGRV